MKQLACVIFFLTILFPASSQKKYPSLLWKISGNGLKKPSYLYGTMHVSNRVAYYLSEQFFAALNDVEVVGLETNPGEWLDNMERTGELEQISNGRTPAYANFYKEAFNVSFPDKRILQGILSYDPDIINGLLYRQNRSKENFEESTYIDLFIFQSASKLNKKMISLENFAQSEIKARLSAIPDEDGRGNDLNPNSFYTSAQRIEDAYREGNLDMIDSLSRMGSSKNMQRYLINDRNVFFVNTIDSVIRRETLFAGVGAAHLPGDNGVIELLRRKGYSVEPVMPVVSKKSHNMREQLDVRLKPVNFSRQYLPDSIFSVSLPGKLSTIVNLPSIQYYIHPDMVNGNFYTVVRLKHLGPLFGITPAQLMQRMDSLLFEHIPGKIMRRTEITSNNGLKGIEVVNKTRRGDSQRYQLFFNDLEMVLLKLGGKGDYALSDNAKEFFGSVRFNAVSQGTVAFTPPAGGFSVQVPAGYSYVKHEGGTVTGEVEELFAYDKRGNQGFGVRQAVYNDFNYLEEDTFELNQLATGILKNYGFTGVASRPSSELGFPCIRFSGKNAFANLYGKVYIKGVHYYFVYQFSGGDDGFETPFFNSFRLTDFRYLNPIREVTDKDFYFRVKDEVTDNALSRFNEAYVRAYELTRGHSDSAAKDFDFRTSNKYYYSPSSSEYVQITLEKYNDYDYRDSSAIAGMIAESLGHMSTARVSMVESGRKKGSRSFTYLLRDTATSRAIKTKVIFKNGLMYEVCAPFDTTIGLKGWAAGFMNTFAPLDTVIGKDIFLNKFPLLLEDLASPDSAVRRRANTSVRSVSMHKAFAPAFNRFISGNTVNKVNDESRAQLFVNGGTLGNEKIIEPYKQLYKQYTDSFYLQLCLLKGLSCLKTQSSYNTFYQLLKAETPLVGDESTVSDVFSMLHDSLGLCRGFFPGILSLARYDEYRNPVYALMAAMVEAKLLPSPMYATQRENILLDANLALKRYTPAPIHSGNEGGQLDFLEKNAREMAETIKGNLEGLAANNFYRNSEYLSSLETSSRPALVNYAYVLSPFYKTDEKTRQFFARLGKIREQNIMMPVAINLLKQGVVLNDTLLSYYSRNRHTRAYFYSELEKKGLTGYFDKKYFSQESINESLLSSQKQLSGYYNNNGDLSVRDSMLLIAQTEARNKYQDGRMYIYRNIRPRGEEEWSAVFISAGEKPVTPRIELVNSGYFIDPGKSRQENINEILAQFNLQFRKRANATGQQQ